MLTLSRVLFVDVQQKDDVALIEIGFPSCYGDDVVFNNCNGAALSDLGDGGTSTIPILYHLKINQVRIKSRGGIVQGYDDGFFCGPSDMIPWRFAWLSLIN
jgi:hypothetical protein